MPTIYSFSHSFSVDHSDLFSRQHFCHSLTHFLTLPPSDLAVRSSAKEQIEHPGKKIVSVVAHKNVTSDSVDQDHLRALHDQPRAGVQHPMDADARRDRNPSPIVHGRDRWSNEATPDLLLLAHPRDPTPHLLVPCVLILRHRIRSTATLCWPRFAFPSEKTNLTVPMVASLRLREQFIFLIFFENYH